MGYLSLDHIPNAGHGKFNILQLIGKPLLVGVSYFLGGEFDRFFAATSPASFWAPNAVLLAALMLTPVRSWWLYFLAVLPADFAISRGMPTWVGCGLCLSNSLQSILAALLMRAVWPGEPRWDQTRFLIRYVLFAVVLAPIVGTLSGAATISAFRDLPFWITWRGWFVANVLTNLALTPALAIMAARVSGRTRNLHLPRQLETGMMFAGLVGVAVVAFELQRAGAGSEHALLYLPLPFLLWAAVRLGLGRANAAILIVVLVAIHGTAHGGGPFAEKSSENVLHLQLFLIAMGLPLMWLAAVIEEGRAKTQTLQESERRFRAMADTAPVMIWMAGTDMGSTFFSKGWLDFTGRPLAQELGNGWTEAVHPDDRDRCLAIYAKAFEVRERFSMEYRLRGADGKYQWFLVVGVPRISVDGTFAGYIGSCTDITDRRLTEEARWRLAHAARLVMMGELTASIAHEINQPLGAILSNAEAAEMLLNSASPPMSEIREIVNDIRRDDLRASTVIKQMRVLLQNRKLTRRELNITDMASSVVRLVQSEAHRRNVMIRTDFGAKPLIVMGDVIHLEQVLLNLIMNGMDAMTDTAPGKRILMVRISSRAGDSAVELAVEDRGHGISEEHARQLFDSFFTTKHEGMGLGLSIARSVIKAHDGNISAENNPAGGATFRCIIPTMSRERKVRNQLHEVVAEV